MDEVKRDFLHGELNGGSQQYRCTGWPTGAPYARFNDLYRSGNVIAPNERMATAVIEYFKQVTKEGDLRIHPIVSKITDTEALEKIGAEASHDA